MFTIEQALSKYTDMINKNSLNINFLMNNLYEKDKKEFKELTKTINLLDSYQNSIKFDQLFEKLDTYKNDIYGDLDNVANFRGNNIKETTRINLDKIFNEAFKNE